MIAPNYLATQGDRRVAIDAIRLTRHIMAQSALAKYNPTEIKPGIAYETDEDLAKAAGDIGTTIFHPTCTVRMGTDDRAPLDGEMRMRGIANLRVVDASAMPKITSGNTNSPTIMMAEKASDIILNNL